MSYSDDDEFGPDPAWMDGHTGNEEAKEDHLAGTPNDVAHLRMALELIGTDCRRYIGTPTCVDGGGRSPYARYGAEQWCEGCIARVGLGGEPFPARGTSGVEETPFGRLEDQGVS